MDSAKKSMGEPGGKMTKARNSVFHPDPLNLGEFEIWEWDQYSKGKFSGLY